MKSIAARIGKSDQSIYQLTLPASMNHTEPQDSDIPTSAAARAPHIPDLISVK